MIELEKTIVAVITNHMQPFVEKVNNMLKMFKELEFTKKDVEKITEDILHNEIVKFQSLLLTIFISICAIGMFYLGGLYVSMATY